MELIYLVSKEVFVDFLNLKFIFFYLGEDSIRELEMRFNPPNINDDGDLNIYIQKFFKLSSIFYKF